MRWWVSITKAWESLGYQALSYVCAQQARRKIEEGGAVSWTDLQYLASLERKSYTPHTPNFSALHVAPEARKRKQARLQLLFSRGPDAQLGEYIQALWQNADISTAIFCGMADRVLTSDHHWLISALYKVGEPRAAIDEFFTLIVDRSLKNWLQELQEQLMVCGLALRDLHDDVTAFACFQLVSWMHPEARTGAGEEANPSHVAHDHAQRLQWAETLLDTMEPSVGWSPAGPQIGQWLWTQGLPGYYLRYLRHADNIFQVYSSALITRQLRRMGKQYGWLESTLPDWSRRRRDNNTVPIGFLEPPSTFPELSRATNHCLRESVGKGTTNPTRNCRRFTSVVETFALPDLVKKDAMCPSIAACNVHIGFSLAEETGLSLAEGTKHASLPLSPLAPVLCIGEFTTRNFYNSIISQILRQGMKVVWVHKEEETASETVAMPEPSWMSITYGNETSPESLQWCRDLAKSQVLRQSVHHVLAPLLPPCRDPAAPACLDLLLTKMTEDNVWQALTHYSRQQLHEVAVSIVDEGAQLSFRHPRDLRRAAALIGYVRHALEALHHACMIQCLSPYSYEGNSGEEQRLVYQEPEGIFIYLKPKDSLRAALLGILSLGSLLHTENQARISTEETADPLQNYDFQIRKRGASPQDDESSSPFEETGIVTHRQSRRNTEHFSRDNPWVARRILSPDADSTFCILLSGMWGRETEEIIAWCRAHAMGQYHSLLVVTKRIPPRWLSWEMFSAFRMLVLGNITDQQRQQMEVATGIQLGGMSHNQSLGRHGAYAFRLHNGKVARSRLLVWPPQQGKTQAESAIHGRG
jgi:hypothetical protein